jgi:hypothetical protein
MIELAPITQNKMTYVEAILYCQFLVHLGHRDWRLPTTEELIELNQHLPAFKELEGVIAPDAVSSLYRYWYNNHPYPAIKRVVLPVRDI